jgi:DNA-directed RNA polymerase subunit RPC12/RpoP
MSVKFHCEHCGKKIEAQDSAGGKWAKCPSCHNKIYVPAPETGEELKLSPVNEIEEAKEQQLMNETYQLTQDILQEREPTAGLADGVVKDMNEKELTTNVILYLREMADGDLGHAEQALAVITPYKKQVERIVDQLSISDIPEPEVSDIPKQVLAGLIRDLRSKIR